MKNTIMKNTVKILSLVIIMVLTSCSDEPIIESKAADQSVESKSNKSTISVFEKPGGFPDGELLVIEGATSTLKRNKNGITGNINTNGLIPGNAYTMWFVIFRDAPGPPNSIYAAGHIAGGSGKGNFSAHISVGEIFDTGDIFDNPLTAEVHIVIRSHGQAVPGMIPDQIHTFGGGCNPDLTFPEGPGRIWPDSDQVGYCANIQVAIHPSVN